MMCNWIPSIQLLYNMISYTETSIQPEYKIQLIYEVQKCEIYKREWNGMAAEY